MRQIGKHVQLAFQQAGALGVRSAHRAAVPFGHRLAFGGHGGDDRVDGVRLVGRHRFSIVAVADVVLVFVTHCTILSRQGHDAG